MRAAGIGASAAVDCRHAAGTWLVSAGHGPRVLAEPTWRLTLSCWTVGTLPLGSVVAIIWSNASYVRVVAWLAPASSGSSVVSGLPFWSNVWVMSNVALPAR